MDFDSLDKEQGKEVVTVSEGVDSTGVFPLGSPSNASLPRAYHSAMESLHDTWGDLIDAFDSLPAQAGWRRRSVKAFVGSTAIEKIQDALNREFAFLGNDSDPDRERAELAAKRIAEGITYLRQVVMQKIEARV